MTRARENRFIFFINNDAKLLYLDTQTAKLTAKERESVFVLFIGPQKEEMDGDLKEQSVLFR